MKTRDTDYLYASMRVRSLEKNLLDSVALDALIDAASFEDMAKTLSNFGYSDMQNVNALEIEKVLATARRETYTTMSEISPNKAICDVFRMKYDYHNVKVILKSDAAGQSSESLLIDAGRYSAKALASAIHQGDLRDLSDALKDAIPRAREVLSRTEDAQSCDLILDHAYFDEMKAEAMKSNDSFLKGYVSILIDTLNLRIAVRAARQKKDADFLSKALVSGGSISKDRIESAYMSGSLGDAYTGTELEEAHSLSHTGASLTQFERACDNAVMKYLKSARYVAFGEAPLTAYIAAREADITAIRIIAAGKAQDLPRDEIRERLRECYV